MAPRDQKTALTQGQIQSEILGEAQCDKGANK